MYGVKSSVINSNVIIIGRNSNVIVIIPGR